jgi:hypothetical protein
MLELSNTTSGYLGQPWYSSQQYIFNAGLGCRGNRNGISVTAQAGCDPDDVHLRNGRGMLRDATIRNVFRCHVRSPFSFCGFAGPFISRAAGSADDRRRTQRKKYDLLLEKSVEVICNHLTEMSIARINKIGSLPQAGAASFSCHKNTARH